MENIIVRGAALKDKLARITLRHLPDRPGVVARIFHVIAEADIVNELRIAGGQNGWIVRIAHGGEGQLLIAMEHPRRRRIGLTVQSWARASSPVEVIHRGKRSLVRIAPGPMTTLG